MHLRPFARETHHHIPSLPPNQGTSESVKKFFSASFFVPFARKLPTPTHQPGSLERMSGALDHAKAKYLFDCIDKDNSGTITYKELVAFNKKNGKGRGAQQLNDEQWREIFELMDADNSGAINRKEFEKFRNDIGGEWNVTNFNKNIGKFRSKKALNSLPTSPTARSPTARSPVRNRLPQMSGVSLRLLLPAQMAAFLCVLDSLRSRQSLSFSVSVSVSVSVAIRPPGLPSVSSSYVSSLLFLFPC